jgi:hypothetical protein
MDTGKDKAPAFPPEEEQTGLYRRPGASAPSRSEDSSARGMQDSPRVRRQQDADPGSAPASPHTDPGLEVGSIRTSGLGGVTYDAKGDPVWEWRVDVPRRRQDDPTIDLLKCLDVDELRLEDDGKEVDEGINPYDTHVRLRK